MVFTDKITLYTSLICPFAQRAAITLREVGANFESIQIDLLNKPTWYKDINPELKVPTIHTEGQNLAESLVIIEYLHDRFPEKKLLPEEPIKRANIRFAIEYFGSKVAPTLYKLIPNYTDANAIEEFKKNTNDALIRFNELLVKESASGPYFLGEQFSLADIAIAPFIMRIFAFNKRYLNGYEFDAIKSSTRLAEFFKGITSRPSVKETYIGDEGYIEGLQKRYSNLN
ncbi:thioredoxin-like protein [Cokeromyces recurvatus]|uniref:thioredoxin-like protein n=1 Tax=Cokeromyces recurvatus TaxID=90255 RepID=UPI00221E896D|nr:thioredoxin-like protein [Cokeromyces recurvatus]KAI7907543.1 thioredoxin-like protein [Cokeromyces recurvatus]